MFDAAKELGIDVTGEEEIEPVYIKGIGYGTFMTEALKDLQEDMKSSAWGVPIELLKIVKVEGYRRLSQPYSGFPFVVKEEGHSFLGMTFQIEEHFMKQLDRVEHVPRLYTREVVSLDGTDYFIYIPSKATYEDHVKVIHVANPPDYWHERVRMAMNDFAKQKFSELTEEIEGADLVRKRFTY